MVEYSVKLSEIADLQIGYQTREKIEEAWNGSHQLFRYEGYDPVKGLHTLSVMRFNPTISPERYTFDIGDILFLARGKERVVYYNNASLDNAVAANSFYIIRIQDQEALLPAYLAWWLKQPSAQAYFTQYEGQSTIPFIRKRTLANCPVVVPDVKTQQRIANLNDLWLEEKKLQHRLMAKKETLIQAVARRAVENTLEKNA